MNSPATSVARLRTHRSAIVAWLLFSRKNRCKPFLEFCNTIPSKNGHPRQWPVAVHWSGISSGQQQQRLEYRRILQSMEDF